MKKILTLSTILIFVGANLEAEVKQKYTTTTSKSILNSKGVYVTSQCYTKTKDEKGDIHNPCFSCHIDSKAPNYINDPDLQMAYDFSTSTNKNPFTNLFKDRTKELDAISDKEIMDYVKKSNYFDDKNQIILAEILKNPPKEWDYNGDGKWSGYTPDCYFNFDKDGFDKDKNNNFTGWRAFGYYPFLGTFWPTNGSTDDVLIRLAKILQQDSHGKFKLSVYKLNLAIVESLIKKKNVKIEATDEKIYGVDLNQNNKLDIANEIVFKWKKPKYDLKTAKIHDFSMYYVGKAKDAQISNELEIAPGLYPKNTEFLHTVRYLDHDKNNIKMAKRIKELRYGKKTHWNNYGQLRNLAMSEIKEKEAWADRLRTIMGDSEVGLGNGQGWRFAGFIEDKQGYLRPQNYEETLYCIGCHSGIGATADSTFAFKRKFDHTHFQKGWYHWTQNKNGFKNIKEPKTPDNRDEYSLYLKQNHAGDEFRTNDEVITKFFDKNGKIKQSELDILSKDISHLLYPSIQRAIMLNKAYKVIVDEQSYIYGRDAHVKPVKNVHKELEPAESTGITDPVLYYLR